MPGQRRHGDHDADQGDLPLIPGWGKGAHAGGAQRHHRRQQAQQQPRRYEGRGDDAPKYARRHRHQGAQAQYGAGLDRRIVQLLVQIDHRKIDKNALQADEDERRHGHGAQGGLAQHRTDGFVHVAKSQLLLRPAVTVEGLAAGFKAQCDQQAQDGHHDQGLLPADPDRQGQHQGTGDGDASGHTRLFDGENQRRHSSRRMAGQDFRTGRCRRGGAGADQQAADQQCRRADHRTKFGQGGKTQTNRHQQAAHLADPNGAIADDKGATTRHHHHAHEGEDPGVDQHGFRCHAQIKRDRREKHRYGGLGNSRHGLLDQHGNDGKEEQGHAQVM